MRIQKDLTIDPIDMARMPGLDLTQLSKVDREAGNVGFLKWAELSIIGDGPDRLCRFYIDDNGILLAVIRLLNEKKPNFYFQLYSWFMNGHTLCTQNHSVNQNWPQVPFDLLDFYPKTTPLPKLYENHLIKLTKMTSGDLKPLSMEKQNISRALRTRHTRRLTYLTVNGYLTPNGPHYRTTVKLLLLQFLRPILPR